MHMFDARDDRRISGNLFDSMPAFIYDVVLLFEGKSEDIFTFNQNPGILQSIKATKALPNQN